MSYRWPTKLSRFGISDPLLKVLVVKYENEIPWQVEVRDEASLAAFVTEVMWPAQLRRMDSSAIGSKRNCLVTPRHVDLELALGNDNELDREVVEILGLIRDESGPEEAREELVKVVNERKLRAFAEWCSHFKTAYCVLTLHVGR